MGTLWVLTVVTGLVHLATGSLAVAHTRLRGAKAAWWVIAAGFLVLGMVRLASASGALASADAVRPAALLLATLHLGIAVLLLAGVVFAGRAARRSMARVDEVRALNDELTRSEKRYKFLVDRLPEAFLVLEEDRIVFASRACRSVCGLPPEEAVGKRLEELIHPRWREAYSRRLDVNPTTGSLGIQRMELELVHPDGQLRWTELRFQLTTWSERPAEIVLASDLTDRRRAEQRLLRLNQVLTSLGNDFRENVGKLTAACGELLGATCALYNRLDEGTLCTIGEWQAPADLRRADTPDGHVCFDVIRRGDADRSLVVRNLPDTPYARTDPNVARYGLRTYAGHPVTLAGRTIGSLCVVYQSDRSLDESDTRILQVVARAIATEEERRGAEELQRAIFEISEAAHLADNLQELFVSIHAVVGRLMEARNLYIALYDPATDLITFPYWSDEEDGPPKPRKPGRGLTEYVLRTSRPTLVSPQRFEELATEGEVESIGAPSIDWLGVPLVVGEATIGVLVVQTYTAGTRYGLREQDILTFVSRQIAVAIERKRLEDRLRLSQRIEALGQLAGGVAHDFNNLLMAIRGSTELLQQRLGADGEVVEELNTIQRSVRRASELTRGLLAFARRQVLDAVALDLNQIVQQILPILRRVIPENIGIDFRPDGRLGTVRADRNQIDQILMNLCVNSRDAMASGGTITIRTRNAALGDDYVATHPWSRPGDYVLLSVEDTGAGMDAHTQRHIFEPFFTTKEPGKGSGLGLATVYGIVKQHDGLIDVDSREGEGTAVNVYLPEVEGVPSDVELPEPGPVVGGSETILVVEDEAEVRRIVVEVLAGLGYRVLAAADGVEALEVLRSGSREVDLVLTDVIMPRMGGRELFDAAGMIPVRPRFLFSSGYGEALVAGSVVGGEWTAFIAKPYGIDELARKVRELLDRAAPHSS